MRRVLLLLMSGVLFYSGVAEARSGQKSPFDVITDPEDREHLPEVAQIMSSRKPELAALDGLLLKLGRPTLLRAMVQAARAALLNEAKRNADAIAAIEEAVRLAPDNPEPKLLAVYIMTFSGGAQRAADLWMMASVQAPESARETDEYVLSSLVGRLRDQGDRARADKIQARMGEIGVVSADVVAQSASALARIRAKIEQKAFDDARVLIPDVVSATDLETLYTDRRYEMLWPAIEQWAGPKLDRQSRIFAIELRSAWQSSGSFKQGAAYASLLINAGSHQAVVDIFFDKLSSEQLTGDAKDVEFLAPRVATSLTALGRGDEAIALLSRLNAFLPVEARARRLNFSGNIALTQLNLGLWNAAATTTQSWLVEAKALGYGVNKSAILGVLQVRACALIKAGRASEAIEEITGILSERRNSPAPALSLYACQNDVLKANELVIEHLADEAMRSWALSKLQPGKERKFTAFQKELAAFYDALRADESVRIATNKVGRILTYAVGGELPPEFVPDDPAYRAKRIPYNN